MAHVRAFDENMPAFERKTGPSPTDPGNLAVGTGPDHVTPNLGRRCPAVLRLEGGDDSPPTFGPGWVYTTNNNKIYFITYLSFLSVIHAVEHSTQYSKHFVQHSRTFYFYFVTFYVIIVFTVGKTQKKH